MKTSICRFLVLFFAFFILNFSANAANFTPSHAGVEFEGSIPKEFEEACIERDKALKKKSQKVGEIKNLEQVKNLLREGDFSLARLQNVLGDENFSFIIAFDPNIKLIVDALQRGAPRELESTAITQIRKLLS